MMLELMLMVMRGLEGLVMAMIKEMTRDGDGDA